MTTTTPKTQPIRPLSVPLRADNAAAVHQLRVALGAICEGDSSISFAPSIANEIIVRGTSELELELGIDRLRRESGATFEIGAPEVAYLETIAKVIDHRYTHELLRGSKGEFAAVRMCFAPLAFGSGFEFEVTASSEAVPEEYVAGVRAGIELARNKGIVAGFPLTDFKATLVDGTHHTTDSSALSFRAAAEACFHEAVPRAAPRLLEPMMMTVVATPPEYLGDVIGDLSSRRGQIVGLEQTGDLQTVSAVVSLANLFGYANAVRRLTHREAPLKITFHCYEPVVHLPGSR
jgi:elongation factor G